jgi:hypothetical protein
MAADPEPAVPVPGVREQLAAAVQPLLDRVGGRLVEVADAQPGDVPLMWDGAVVVLVRLGSPHWGQDAAAVPSATAQEGQAAAPSADLSDGLARLIAEIEAELGGSLSSLGRPEKQRAVRLLEERGAFEMRRSAETVAEALGVTRFTVYNYLNRGREPRA